MTLPPLQIVFGCLCTLVQFIPIMNDAPIETYGATYIVLNMTSP